MREFSSESGKIIDYKESMEGRKAWNIFCSCPSH